MISVIGRVIVITITVVASVIVFEALMRWLRKAIESKSNRRNTRRVINIFRLIFYCFVAIVELGVWGVNLVAILAGAGFLGIIIGLAVQQPLGNFFSGVYIVISRIVKEGEVISVNAIGSNIMITGIVRHIGFSHTELLDSKGRLNIVPNNVLISSILTRLDGHEKEKVH
jgi:small conductance mechanosensitive channel